MTPTLTIAQARRIALNAQGMGRLRTAAANPEQAATHAPAKPLPVVSNGSSAGAANLNPARLRGQVPRQVGLRQVSSEIARVAQFQIDTVNVLARAHYLPLYTRLGAYDTALLHRASEGRDRKLFEYWGHAACLIDVELYPALRWRMEEAKSKDWTTLKKLVTEKPRLVNAVLDEINRRGPLTQRQLVDAGIGERRQSTGWWGWGETKRIVEYLFYIGVLGVAGRNSQFERRYDLIERVIPQSVLQRAEMPKQDAQIELVRRAAAALGVATTRGLGHYFYLSNKDVRDAIDALVERGELEPVTITGVREQAYLWHEARCPRRISGTTLVSPFDSLIFERRRLQQLFGVEYTIGLYTPKEQRDYGYYVYLFVLDEAVAARVDLKADRKAGVLLVQAAWLEPSYGDQLAQAGGRAVARALPTRDLAAEVARPLAAELYRLAGWLGLAAINVAEQGDLADQLTKVL